MTDSKQTQGKEEVGEKLGCKLEGAGSYLIQRISKKMLYLAAHKYKKEQVRHSIQSLIYALTIQKIWSTNLSMYITAFKKSMAL